MSQRIADSLEVLDLVCGIARQSPNKIASAWRQEAITHVASRGVEKNTVFAHLVGKNTPYTLSAAEIDRLIAAWINDGSHDLKNWILKSCGNSDSSRVNLFFIAAHATPLASDINEPQETEKHLVTTYRVLRDTALARRIKADRNYECQICNVRILLGDSTPYAEAHHVKPLGNPHNGPDHPSNIVCVCPNCHVKLDYGAIKIGQALFVNVHPDFIHYHNNIICKIKG